MVILLGLDWPLENDRLRQLVAGCGPSALGGTTRHQVSWLGHYWKFGPERFDDVLGFIRDDAGGHADDPQVALLLAFQIFVDADRPQPLLDAP